ncbi:MAG: hypothetical protein ACRYHA_32540 [Janthinobacterium lividum]
MLPPFSKLTYLTPTSTLTIQSDQADTCIGKRLPGSAANGSGG